MVINNTNLYSETFNVIKNFIKTQITDPRNRSKGNWVHDSMPLVTDKGFEGYPFVIIRSDVADDGATRGKDGQTVNETFRIQLRVMSDQGKEIDSISDQIAQKFRNGNVFVDSLISYYRFDDDESNTDVIDSFGGKNGTATADTDTMSTTGKLNKALNFDGTETVVVSDDDVFDANNISVAFWMKTSSSDEMEVVRKWESLSDQRSWAIWIDSSNKVRFRVSTDGDNNAINAKSTTSINDNAWHHIVCTFDGSNVKIYFDGVLEGTDSISGDLFSSTSDIKFGDSFLVANNFTGDLDDVRIYSKGLSDDEILAIYNSGNGTEDVSPIVTADQLSEFPERELSSSPIDWDLDLNGKKVLFRNIGLILKERI